MTEVLDNQSIAEGKDLIRKGINELNDKNYEAAKNYFFEGQKRFTAIKSSEYISVCMSLTALTTYLIDKKSYKTVLQTLQDSVYMADYSKSNTAKLFAEIAQGNVNFGEGNKDIALIHYNNAKELNQINDEFLMSDYISARINQLQNNLDFSLPIKSDPLVSLVKIGRSITALTDINVLLRVIAEETKNAIQADRCTVFILDKEKNELWSKVALGMDSQEIRFPADKGFAGYVVQTGETVNIEDAYNDSRFNKDVDVKSGYHTKTILCMPIKNNNQEIIGAFQVLNKFSGTFTQNDEDLLVAIGGSASIALENAQLFEQQKELYKEQKNLFESFIDTLAKSIDARDKITSGHSSRVKLYTMLIVDALHLNDNDKEIIEKAAILHDIGKIG
ncbi:GAF domain-containing protein, partial [bacterium]|nr:GAF domain-containing protein [bacterium]